MAKNKAQDQEQANSGSSAAEDFGGNGSNEQGAGTPEADKAAADKAAADKAAADKAAAETPKKGQNIKAAQGDPENNYVPKDKKEFGHFHVRLEKTQFDGKTGKRLSKPFIQKYTVEAWDTCEAGLPGLGYDYKVVWNPTKL